MTPDWMNPQSGSYDPNWMNNTSPLPSAIWTRFNNGDVQPTVSRVHLKHWMDTMGAVIIDAPGAEDSNL